MTTHTTIQPTQLPSTIRAYLAAHAAGEADAAIRTLTPPPWSSTRARPSEAPVEVLEFLRNAGGEFTYTTELVGAQHIDDAHWVAINRLEGDFPGGVAELSYRFTLARRPHRRAGHHPLGTRGAPMLEARSIPAAGVTTAVPDRAPLKGKDIT